MEKQVHSSSKQTTGLLTVCSSPLKSSGVPISISMAATSRQLENATTTIIAKRFGVTCSRRVADGAKLTVSACALNSYLSSRTGLAHSTTAKKTRKTYRGTHLGRDSRHGFLRSFP